jgi:hypothetical protein
MDMIFEFETGVVVVVGSEEPGSGLIVDVDMMARLRRLPSGV